MLIVGLPVLDGHEMTRECVGMMVANAEYQPGLLIVIIDNGSREPYRLEEFQNLQQVGIAIVWHDTNQGFYTPLRDVAGFAGSSADLVALMHNDVLIYEPGWDRRITTAFVGTGSLGLLGFCGSDEIDDRGGRGGGTMCNFAGLKGQLQQHTGKKITGLHPALLLDSLFMCFQMSALSALGPIDEHLPICHFVDKLWSVRMHAAGWKVGVLGVLIDHLGGQTAVAMPRFAQEAREWCEREGIGRVVGASATAEEAGSLALYLEAERRFLSEARAWGYLPSRLVADWHSRVR